MSIITTGFWLVFTHFLRMSSMRQAFKSSRNKLDVEAPTEISHPIAFMHVPKTSGTALISGLTRALDLPFAFGGFDQCLFGSFRDFDKLEENIRRHIYASPACLPADVKLVAAHMALSTLRKAYPFGKYLTLLREPTSRLLSHWLYWRQHSDEELVTWGIWAERMRSARLPLATFLKQPILACQTDNLTLRMLLWPHPLIPEDGFIEPSDDERLFTEAMAQLRTFDFQDVVENVHLTRNIQQWLGRPFSYEKHNETGVIPDSFRSQLHRELTSEAYELITARSRLDLRLWTSLATHRMPYHDISSLREKTVMVNVARYSVLMS